MYYISKLLLSDIKVDNIQIKIKKDLYKYSITIELYDTETKETKLVEYKDLKGNEFGVVNRSLYQVTSDLWKFLDYVDKPKFVSGIKETKQGEYMVGDKHIIILNNSVPYSPVDENCVFWIHHSTKITTVAYEQCVITLLDIYLYLMKTFNTVTVDTEVYFYNYRLFLNKEIIRFITKLMTLRR